MVWHHLAVLPVIPRALVVLLGLVTALGFAAPATATTPADVGPPAPPGVNDFSCRPSAGHPRPVVLVHGTFSNRQDDWALDGPALVHAGYCVFALNYGAGPFSAATRSYAVGPIADSAAQLAAFVDEVLAATDASQVDVVGHSQGGLMPRYYLRFLGGAGKVHTLVGLAPSNHGTTLSGLTTLAVLVPSAPALLTLGNCQACLDQLRGSPFLTALNAGGDTVPGVDYTVVATRFDEVVTPYASQFLAGPRVTNVLLQDVCPLEVTEHIGMSFDPTVLAITEHALDPATPAPTAC